MSPQQNKFDEFYICSSEITKRLNITRSTLQAARQNNQLPEPISINNNQIFIWERQQFQPYLDKWIARRERGSI